MSNPSLYEKVPELENNFSIKFRLYQLSSPVLAHWHEHTELVYILDGECICYVDGTTFTAHAGDLIVVNSAEVHSFEMKHQLIFYSVLLYPSFFGGVDFKDIYISNVISGDKYIGKCFSNMKKEYDSHDSTSAMMLKSYAYRLMAYLGKTHRVDAVAHTKKNGQQNLERLNKVLKYISEKYTEKISVNALAAMCYLSESHFCRFFKSTTGKSAVEYINDYRIEKSCVLLKNTDEPITTVATLSGFDDINYFSRTFKKRKGITPREFRKTAD